MLIQQKFFQAGSYLQYWLRAVNHYSLHSPFAYELYTKAIKPDRQETAFKAIEQIRAELLKNPQPIQLRELGAGSSVNRSKKRPLSDIAHHSLSSASCSRLLYRLIRHMKAETILELGTSLGINTLYLSSASPAGKVYTLEGCPQTAATARKVFQQYQALSMEQHQNIRLEEGPIDEMLPKLLREQQPTLDAAYLDANHTYEASIRYFKLLLPHLHNNSFVVVDDIYWSPGMKKAWKEMQQHPRVSLSLDLYKVGILFFQPGLQAGHAAHYVIT